LIAATYMGQWTVFALPGEVWAWWSFHYLLTAVVAGAFMGAAVERFSD
jgi:hypothetical protein